MVVLKFVPLSQYCNHIQFMNGLLRCQGFLAIFEVKNIVDKSTSGRVASAEEYAVTKLYRKQRFGMLNCGYGRDGEKLGWCR